MYTHEHIHYARNMVKVRIWDIQPEKLYSTKNMGPILENEVLGLNNSLININT